MNKDINLHEENPNSNLIYTFLILSYLWAENESKFRKNNLKTKKILTNFGKEYINSNFNISDNTVKKYIRQLRKDKILGIDDEDVPIFNLVEIIKKLFKSHNEDEMILKSIIQEFLENEEDIKKSLKRSLLLQSKAKKPLKTLLKIFNNEVSQIIMNFNFELFLLQFLKLFPNYLDWQIKSNTIRRIYSEADDSLRELGFTVFEDQLKFLKYGDVIKIENISEIKGAFDQFENEIANIDKTGIYNTIFTTPIELKGSNILINLICGIIKIDTIETKSLDTSVLHKVMEFYFTKILEELAKIPNENPIRVNLEINGKKFYKDL